MFHFELSKEEELVRESARDFARGRLLTNFRKAEKDGVDPSVAAEYRSLGFLELEGTDGLGSLAKALVLEELGAGDAGAVLALDGWGPALYVALEMTPDGSRWRERAFSGERATLWTGNPDGPLSWVPAKSGAIITLDAPKAALFEPKEWKETLPLALHAAGSSEVALGAAVDRIENPAGATRALARARLYIAALLTGVARAAYEYARRYTQERVAFGKPIAHHQAVAFTLADMAIGVDAARLAAWRIAWAVDRKSEEARCAAEGYGEAADQALWITNSAVQLLGGHGFMKEHPVEKWYREARALTLLWGGRDAAVEELAALA